MRESVYNHFKSIYGECCDAIVCFDDKLNVVYATNSVYDLLGTDNREGLHLSCMFALSEFNKITDCVSKNKYLSFEYVNTVNDLVLKVSITPTKLEKIFYYVLTLVPTYKSELDRKQKYGIEVCVDAAATQVVKSTVDVVNSVTELESTNPKLYNSIIDNVLIIRKQFCNIEALATQKLKKPADHVVELGSYIERICDVIKEHLGNKIEFCLDLSNDILISKVSYQALDLIVCNVVSAFLNNNFAKATVTISTSFVNGSNVIVFSSSHNGMRKFKDVYSIDSNNYMLCNSTDMAIEVAKKLAGDCGGSLKVVQAVNGKFAFVLALPDSPVRDRVLFAPKRCYDLKEPLSLIKVMLSDIEDFLI